MRSRGGIPRVVTAVVLWTATAAFLSIAAVAVSDARPRSSVRAIPANRVESASAAPQSHAGRFKVADPYGELPLGFEPNLGQTDSRVKFLSRGTGYTLFLTPAEAVLALRSSARVPSLKVPLPDRKREANRGWRGEDAQVLRMTLVGANPHARIEGADPLPGISNYFIGNEPKNWHTKIPNYARVRYRDVYPGIDLVYYGASRRQLEYDFILAPGADPKAIAVRFEGANRLALNQDGDVVATLAGGGKVIQRLPAIYQEQRDGKREKLDGRCVLLGKRSNTIGFALAAYDRTRAVHIDPVLSYPGLHLDYSTYLGGSDPDAAFGVALDSTGNAYVVGYTYSVDFPATTGAYQRISTPMRAGPTPSSQNWIRRCPEARH